MQSTQCNQQYCNLVHIRVSSRCVTIGESFPYFSVTQSTGDNKTTTQKKYRVMDGASELNKALPDLKWLVALTPVLNAFLFRMFILQSPECALCHSLLSISSWVWCPVMPAAVRALSTLIFSPSSLQALIGETWGQFNTYPLAHLVLLSEDPPGSGPQITAGVLSLGQLTHNIYITGTTCRKSNQRKNTEPISTYCIPVL